MDPEQMTETVSLLRKSFDEGLTIPLQFRRDQLKALEKCLRENERAFVEALGKDLRKNPGEAKLSEVDLCVNAIKTAMLELNSWTSPTHVSKSMLTLFDTLYHYPQPYGLVLIIGPWNFPISLSLLPLIGAIAAGNCVIVKPSEVSPATSEALTKYLASYLDERCFRVIPGGVPETTSLLNLKFDYIFFTGAAKIGRIVSAAASKHLTPTTLELGGKSPVYLDDSVNMDIAARRICWGKFTNAGQICIAPDYVLCSRKTSKIFIEAVRKVIREFYGEDPKASENFGRIINVHHHRRLVKLLSAGNGKTVIGGQSDESDLFIAPTVVTKVDPSSALMQEELFGPIMPIVYVDSARAAVDFINEKSRPLALYVFSSKKSVHKLFREKTFSGALSINDTALHFAVEELPFGGVGESGMGAYRGKFTFDTFSHRRAVLHKNFNFFGEKAGSLRYPPMTDLKVGATATLLKKRRGIPLPTASSLLAFAAGVGVVFLVQALTSVS
ncbi:unnamed protein product [Notodromas monacha]|uniref:Aldehyde dehydrogenase n=1 Tax=Notodromas monacha TaxID=399045 RepID=A0A7R9GB62_9CRUS|nr:unnamed protein product [Notodromas monacha]CAG0916170.1 unnamed protein product [Notodromas monacha]